MIDKFKFLFLVLLIFISEVSSAQNGVFVTTDRDTVNAFFIPGSEFQNRNFVTFKEDSTSEEQQILKPENVLVYSHDRGYFKSLSYQGQKFFFKVQKSGPLNLYYRINEDADIEYFVADDDDKLVLLSSSNYKEILQKISSDIQSNEFDEMLQSTRFNRTDITSVILKYNSIKEPDFYIYEKPKAASNLVVRAIGGFSFNTYDLTIEEVFGLNTGNRFEFSHSAFSPEVGIDLYISSDRILDLGVEMSYTGHSYLLPVANQRIANIDFAEDLEYRLNKFLVNTYLSIDPNESFSFGIGLPIQFTWLIDDPASSRLVSNDNSLFGGVDAHFAYSINRSFQIRASYFYSAGTTLFLNQSRLINQRVGFSIRYSIVKSKL